MEQYPNPALNSGTSAGDVNIGVYDADTILLFKNINPKLFASFNDSLTIKNGIVDDMEKLGAIEETTTTENFHYQEGSYYTTAAVVSRASVTASSVVVTINAQGTSGNYTSFGKIGDMVSLGNSQYWAQITDKNGSSTSATATLTLSRGTDTSFSLADTAVLNDGTILAAPTTLQGHGQAFPDGINLFQVRYQTNIGLMVTATPEMDGSLANQEVYIGVGPNGERYMTTRQLMALTVRAEYERAYGFLFHTGADYTYTDVWGNTRTAQSTAGLYQTANDYAQKYPITPGMLDIDDIYTIATAAVTSQAGNEFMGYLGLGRKQEWDKIIRQYTQTTQVSPADPGAFGAFGSKKSVDGAGNVSLSPDQAMEYAAILGYSTVNVLGCNFHVKTPPELQSQSIIKGDPANAYYAQTMLFLPATKGVSNFNGNQGTGLSFGMKVRMQKNPLTGASQRMMLVDRGPANLGTNAFSRQIIQEYGLTTYNPNKMIYVTK